jgi:hypothetical protein
MNGLEEKINEAVRKFVIDNYESPVVLDFIVIENAMKTAICMYIEMQSAELKRHPFAQTKSNFWRSNDHLSQMQSGNSAD